MRAMDCISSCNLCYLICDTLKLMDQRPIEKGIRTAYILMHLLKDTDAYEDYEIAEFAFLAMLGDIGAYKTGLVKEGMDEKAKEASRNIYSSIFLKKFSIFGKRSNILLYQHLPYELTGKLNDKNLLISQYLYTIRAFDQQYRVGKGTIDVRFFEEQAGKRYLTAAVLSLLRKVNSFRMMDRIKSGEYKEELRAYLEENLIFTNEEKNQLMELVAYIYGLVHPRQTVETLQCARMTKMICENIDMTFQEKDKVYYAAIVHDLGMLAIPREIVNKKEKLTREEGQILQGHVAIAEKILRERFEDMEIVEISNAHHERMDGSGYPYHKKGSQLTRMDGILEAADMAVALMSDRPQRPAMERDAILKALEAMDHSRAVDETVLDCMIRQYDKIDAELQKVKIEYLKKVEQTVHEFKLLRDSNLGDNMQTL